MWKTFIRSTSLVLIEAMKGFGHGLKMQLTSKLAYKLLLDNNALSNQNQPNWRVCLKFPLPQRVLLFGWKCVNNVIIER